MTNRIRLLLGLALALAVMRFAVVPWVQAQAEVHDRLFAVTRQLDRAEAIAGAGPELAARREALAGTVRSLASRAPLAKPGSEHRLAVQREVRAAVESTGLELTVFEWVLDGQSEATGLAFGRLRLQVDGSLRQVAEAHVALEAGLPNIFVRELVVSLRGSGMSGLASATFEVDLYYRTGEPV